MSGTSAKLGNALAYGVALILPPLLFVSAGHLMDLQLPGALVLAELVLGAAIPVWVGLAFMRPPKTLPSGPITDSGTLFGHAWVKTANGYAWVESDQATTVRAQVDAPSHTPTASGFRMPLPPAQPPKFSRWLMWRLLFVGTVGLMLPLTAGKTLEVLAGAAPWIDLVFFVPVLTACLGVGYAIVLSPSWLFAIVLDGGWLPDTQEVTLHGRTLRVDEQSFTAGMPGQTLRMEWNRNGASLVLRNPQGGFTLRGRHDHLLWLKQQLEALPPSGDASAVPQAISTLRAEG